jgi:hypothetical protein
MLGAGVWHRDIVAEERNKRSSEPADRTHLKERETKGSSLRSRVGNKKTKTIVPAFVVPALRKAREAAKFCADASNSKKTGQPPFAPMRKDPADDSDPAAVDDVALIGDGGTIIGGKKKHKARHLLGENHSL